MEALLLLAVPVVVSILTQGVKKLKAVELSSKRKTLIRFFALTASFAGVIATSLAIGGEMPIDEISTYAEAFVAFTATQIPYIFGASKK